MIKPTGVHRFARSVYPLVLSVLSVLAILVSPLLTAMPAYADWGADTMLSTGTVGSTYARVAVSGNNVNVVWQDNRDGNQEIYYKLSTDGGTTWGADTRLTNDPADSAFPAIAASGNSVHVVWEDNRAGNYNIYYKRSTDGGTTWGADTRVSTGAANSLHPSVAVYGNAVHVVWHDGRDGNPDIYYKLSTDGGTTWGADTRLSTGVGNSTYAAVAAYGNNVHVVWSDDRDGNAEIYYKQSMNGGSTWGADTRLTNNPFASIYPRVAVLGSNVQVVWMDNRDGNNEIYYKHSMDSGTTWGADTRLTVNPADSELPAIAVLANSVYVVWNDNRDGNYEIYYKHSTDGGTTWSADTRLTNDPAASQNADVAVAGNNVHVVWDDTRTGIDNIFYKKFTAIPIITSINPNQGYWGQTLDNMIITGINFTGATGASFGDDIDINGFQVASDTQIIVSITINLAEAGLRDISVITPGGSVSLKNGFMVIPTSPSPRSSATIAAPPGPVPLPAVSVKSASLSAARVGPGTPVTVTANVANTGDVNGASSITVYVNGQQESSQGVTVDSGSNTPVTFTVSRNQPGTYTVYVGGTSAGSFVVDLFAGPGPIAVGVSALFLIVFIAAIIIYRRKSRFSR